MIGYRLPGADPPDMVVCVDCRMIQTASSYKTYNCEHCFSKNYVTVSYKKYWKRIGEFMEKPELLTILVQKSG